MKSHNEFKNTEKNKIIIEKCGILYQKHSLFQIVLKLIANIVLTNSQTYKRSNTAGRILIIY